jgi:hypothetical protein
MRYTEGESFVIRQRNNAHHWNKTESAIRFMGRVECYDLSGRIGKDVERSGRGVF